MGYTVIREEHHWTSEEKMKWVGYGEWVEEIDCLHIEHLGFNAIIKRILKKEPFAKEDSYFGGHLCGYVQIPESHPYFRDVENTMTLSCHGGVTFNEAHEEHWIGFDCGHANDLVPSMQDFVKQYQLSKDLRNIFNPVYRNMDFCIKECVELIDQLLFASKVSREKKRHSRRD